MKLPLLQVNPPSNEQQQCIAINQLINGGCNAIGTVTLTNNGTTTTLINQFIKSTSVLFFWPQTADAAGLTSSLWYDPTSVPVNGTVLGGQITLNHSAAAHNDLTFGYVVLN